MKLDEFRGHNTQSRIDVMKGKLILILICGAFLAFGTIAAVSSIYDVSAGLASSDWPTAEGEILKAQRHRGKSKNKKRFEYRYTVEGIEHTNTRAAFVRPPYIDPLYKKYRAGQTVQVHYDPTNPVRSVVEPGVPILGILAEAITPLIMFGLGGAGLFYGLRPRQ